MKFLYSFCQLLLGWKHCDWNRIRDEFKTLSPGFEGSEKQEVLSTKNQGPYSQNFFTQILEIFVTLTWILELISHQKIGILLPIM
jgi:hypothetical protein